MRRITKGDYKQGGVSVPQVEILKAFSEFLTISDIVKFRRTSRNSVNKIIKTLLKKGLIFKKSRGIYELTDSGREGLHSFIGLTYKLRQHNVGIKVKVLESPKNWDKIRSKIITMPCFNKRVQLKNNSYDLMNYGKIQLKITSQSVIFKFPAVYTSSIDEAVIQILELLYKAIPKVESLFNIKLIKDYKANITIISQEYARLNDSLAKLYKKEDNKLYVTDEQGKVWLIADYSFSVNELEAVSPERADEDMDIVHTFFNKLRKSPDVFNEIEKKQLLTEEILKRNTDNLAKLSVQVYEIISKFGDRNI